MPSLPVIICCVCLCGWVVWAYRSAGLRFAVGSTVLLSFLVPTWIGFQFAGLPFDFRIIAAVVVLSLVLWDHREAFKDGLLPAGLGFTDWAVFSMVGVHCLSDWCNGGNVVLVPIRAYGEWLLAYFSGRFACTGTNDLRRLAPIAVLVSTTLAGAAILESSSGINPFEVVAGNRPVELAPREAARMGLKRAFGPTKHAIFLGAVLLLLLPWHAVGFAFNQSGVQLVGRFLALGMIASAIFCTGSRAVILGGLLLAIGGVSLARTRYRPYLAVGIVAIMALGFVWRSELFSAIDRYTQESRRLLHFSITIDGQELPYTGTMNRLYILRLYQPAIRQAGLLGFGTERNSHFPVDVPVREANLPALAEMSTIENAYLLLLLRFGWLGVLAFVTMLAAFIGCAWQLARSFHGFAMSPFFAYATAMMLCVSLLLLTVWMPHDFGFPLLWTGGVLGSLWRFRRAHATKA